jgi:hypothetical protein
MTMAVETRVQAHQHVRYARKKLKQQEIDSVPLTFEESFARLHSFCKEHDIDIGKAKSKLNDA